MQLQIRCTLSWTLEYGKHTRVHIALKPPFFKCHAYHVIFSLLFFSLFYTKIPVLIILVTEKRKKPHKFLSACFFRKVSFSDKYIYKYHF